VWLGDRRGRGSRARATVRRVVDLTNGNGNGGRNDGADCRAAVPSPISSYAAVAHLLLDRGVAQVELANSDGTTPLHVICETGDEADARLLLE